MGTLSSDRVEGILKLANDQLHFLREAAKRAGEAANAPGATAAHVNAAARAHGALEAHLREVGTRASEQAGRSIPRRIGNALLEHATSLPGLAAAGVIGLGGTLARDRIMAKLTKKPSVLKHMFSSHGPVVTALGYGVGAGTIGAGMWGAKKAYDHVNEPIQKQQGMKAMLTMHPNLKNEDHAHVARVYNTLYNFNKDMAKDPLVAGSFVRRAMQFREEGLQPNDIKTLTEIRKHMSDTKGGTYLPTTPSDLSAFGKSKD